MVYSRFDTIMSNYNQYFNGIFDNMQHTQDNDTNFSYYHEYCRLHMANVVLISQMRELVNERNELNSKFSKLEKKTVQLQGAQKSQQKLKRYRRTANEIDRHYRCPLKTCLRSYGSQGSLSQHIKLKHRELYLELAQQKDKFHMKELSSGYSQLNISNQVSQRRIREYGMFLSALRERTVSQINRQRNMDGVCDQDY